MKRILILTLGVLLLAGTVLAQVPMTYPSAYPGNVFEMLLNRAIDSPPYTKGAYAISTSGTLVYFGFRATQAKVGYFCYTYVMLPAANTGYVQLQYLLGGVMKRAITLYPGGSIADYVACDSLTIAKSVAADVVNYGGYYNR